MSNIKFIRLLSGEELICDLSYKDGKYTCKKPIQVFVRQGDKPNSIAMGFGPFLPYTEAGEEFEADRGIVAIVTNPNPQMKNEYERATGSIVTPPTKKFILANE